MTEEEDDEIVEEDTCPMGANDDTCHDEPAVSGSQMTKALQFIARVLSQMQESMDAMREKIQKTDESVKIIARKLREQGTSVQRIDHRVKALETKRSCTTFGHASSVPGFSSPPRPNFVIKSQSTTSSNMKPQYHSKGLREDSFEVLGKNLLKAAQNGRTKYVRLLLDLGADVNFKYGSDWTPLHRAAAKAHEGVVALLLERGANVKARNSYGFTALHIAAYHDFSGRCVQLLLEAGSDVHSKNRSGRVALHYAAESGNVASVRALLTFGAKVDARDDEGRQPLHLAKSIRVRGLLRERNSQRRSRSFVHFSGRKFTKT